MTPILKYPSIQITFYFFYKIHLNELFMQKYTENLCFFYQKMQHKYTTFSAFFPSEITISERTKG